MRNLVAVRILLVLWITAVSLVLVGNSALAFKDDNVPDPSVSDREIRKFNDLISRFDELIGRAYCERGDAYRKSGNLDRAIADYDEAIRRDPAYVEPIHNRGLSFLLKKDYDRAIDDFDKVIKLRLDKAIKLTADDARIFLNRGNAYYEKREYDRAIANFEEAFKLTADDGIILFNRGNARNHPIARVLWLALRNWGDANYLLRKYELAVGYYERARQFDPSHADGLYGRGIARLSQGDRDGGNADIAAAKAIEIDIAEQFAKRGVSDSTGSLESKLQSTGSGFVINKEGEILTNRHVIDRCRTIKVRHSRAGLAEAKFVRADNVNDLAVVRIDLAVLSTEFRSISPLKFRENPEIRVGEITMAIGFPLPSLNQSPNPSVAAGSINSLSGLMNDPNRLEHDAKIQPGSSGGPLLDLSGNVVGILQSTINPDKTRPLTPVPPQNMNYAIKSNLGLKFLVDNKITCETALSNKALERDVVAERGSSSTVLVECYL